MPSFPLLLLLLLPIAATAIDRETDREPVLRSITVQLPWHHQFEFAGLYAAIEQGYYARHGLAVTLREYQFDGKHDPVTQVRSGKAEFALQHSGVIEARLRGEPIRLLANYFKSHPLVVLTRPEIKNLSQLRGRRLMAGENDLENPLLQLAFDAHQLRPGENVELVDSQFEIGPLVRGEVDAMTAFVTNQPYLLQQQGFHFNTLPLSDYLPGFGDSYLITSEALLATDKPLIEAFVRATNDGWYYALEHKREVIDLILQRYSQRKSADALAYEADRIHDLLMPNLMAIGAIPDYTIRHIANAILQQRRGGDPSQLQQFTVSLPNAFTTRLLLTSEERQLLQQLPQQLAVAIDQAPLSEVSDQGEWRGLIHDYWQLLRDRLMLPATLPLQRPFDRVANLLSQNRATLYAGLHLPPAANGEQLYYTNPFLQLPVAFVTARALGYIGDLSVLNGSRIAVTADSGALSVLQVIYPEIEFQLVAEPDQALRQLQRGEVVAVIGVQLLLQQRLMHNDFRDLHLAGDTGLLVPLQFALHLEQIALIPLLNRAIAAIGSREHATIRQRWEVVPPTYTRDYTALWWVIGGTLPIIALILLSSLRLKRIRRTLAESEQFHRTLVQSMSEGVLVLDHAGRVTSANPAAIALLGLSIDQLRQRPLAQQLTLLDTQDEPIGIADSPFSRTLQGDDRETQSIYRYRNRDGADRWLRITCVSIQQKQNLHVSVAAPAVLICTLSDVTAQRQRQQQLRMRQQQYQRLVQDLGEQMVVYSHQADGTVLFASRGIERVFGVTAESMVGRSLVEVAHWRPESLAQIFERIETMLTTGEAVPEFDAVFERLDGVGGVRRIRVLSHPVANASGVYDRIEGIVEDVTEQRQRQRQLRLLAKVFAYVREAILVADQSGRIMDVNDAFCELTGYQRHEVVGKNPSLLSSGRHEQPFFSGMWQQLQQQGRWSGEIWNRHKNGRIYAELVNISAIPGERGEVEHYVAIYSDLSVQKRQQQQLEHISHYDALTGLANRTLLQYRLQQAMSDVQQQRQQLVLLLIDLDEFDQINERWGHEAGDEVLLTAAARLRTLLPEQALARVGGDEFVVMVSGLNDSTACEPLLQRLLELLSAPVTYQQQSLPLGASVGVSSYPQPVEVSADQLLRQATQALFQAKQAGKQRYQLFDAQQQQRLQQRQAELDAVRSGLAAGEFALFYQPKVNLRSGAVVGAEALIRWHHPERGLLTPYHFLPLLAGHPLAAMLDEWVVAESVRQQLAWRAQGFTLPVSINLHTERLQQSDFVAWLTQFWADEPQFDPTLLELEILETELLRDLDAVSARLAQCQALGIHFALDDFGTGYSSLYYLKQLPVATLKIDQQFVRQLPAQPNDLAILDAIAGMAQQLGQQVVVEGVEGELHGEMLLRLGLEVAQGYAIAKPMPASELMAWTARWQPPLAWQQTPRLGRDAVPLLVALLALRQWLQQPTTPTPPAALPAWFTTTTTHHYRQRPSFVALAATIDAWWQQLAATPLSDADRAAQLQQLQQLMVQVDRVLAW